MTNVYVVTSGAYSDYTIDAVFSTEEMANQYIDSCGGKGYGASRIEEYELDRLADKLQQGLIAFAVEMELNGNTRIVKPLQCEPYEEIRLVQPWPQASHSFLPFYTINCWAKDEDHAIKIAGERRIGFVANPKNKSELDSALAVTGNDK